MHRVLIVVLTLALPGPAFAGVLTGQWSGRAGECQLVLEEYDHEVLHLRMRRAGRPRDGDPSRFVTGLLARGAALRDLVPGYTITSVSVEKVLVPTRAMIRARKAVDTFPDERLPYDALLWVRLERNR